ncbi:MAG: hypothetical protein HC848_09210 [Limnobacter sp.]|nr:hypothetical protein [Limnobacter sp.]
MRLLIQGGRLIDPANGLDEPMDLAVAAGRVVALAKPGLIPADFAANQVVDAAGKWVLPGLVDLSVRCASQVTISWPLWKAKFDAALVRRCHQRGLPARHRSGSG